MPILSRGSFPEILYIDGFAGPGEYEGGEPGSPIIALETAAWSRKWSAVKAARARLELLTGLTIVGPLRHELEKKTKALHGDSPRTD